MVADWLKQWDVLLFSKQLLVVWGGSINLFISNRFFVTNICFFHLKHDYKIERAYFAYQKQKIVITWNFQTFMFSLVSPLYELWNSEYFLEVYLLALSRKEILSDSLRFLHERQVWYTNKTLIVEFYGLYRPFKKA